MAGTLASPAIHAVEWLEEVRQMLRCDARARVADPHPYLAALTAATDAHHSTRRRVAHGVVQQIAHRLAQFASIALD